MTTGPEIIWRPTQRQAEFLAASEDEVLYGGSAGGGKGQPLDALVLTPFGYRQMGDLKVGAAVCSPDGSVSHVIATYELGERQIYRVSFDDVTSTEVTGDHIWLAWKSRRSTKQNGDRLSGEMGAKLRLTEQMIECASEFRIPITQPVAFNDSARYPRRPVDPYALGALLGDGSLTPTCLRLTSTDPEIASRVIVGLGEGRGPYVYGERAPEYVWPKGCAAWKYMESVFLIGRDSFSKFIPPAYLLGSVDERWALLRGLMDTDGWADQDGDIYYCTVSTKLCDDVAALARSLGSYVTKRMKEARDQHGNGSQAFTLRLKFRDNRLAFGLERKKALASASPQSMGRPIQTIEPTRMAQARCIKVSHPSGLYLTNDCIVTHNTDALVIDALGGQCRAVEQAEYRALLLRRSYGELKEVVDRTQAIYPRVYPGARYVEPEWRFPSGARLELGYLDRDTDVMQYQSRQFQWIGWEELAQWASSYPYEYMLSRLRRPERLDIPVYVRATCNPDGPGARWIAERWGISANGASCRREMSVDGKTFRLRFIAARLDDNPHLAHTGYRQQLLRLPDEIRRALLDGRWDEPIIGGAIYADALAAARRDGRITSVPYDPTARVDTWWDLGVADSTAIWFTQDIGREVHLIDYYEAQGEGLPHYAAMLDKRGYLFGRHTAPHDIEARELGSGRSRVETALSLGIRFETAPRLGIEDGIHATRMLFPRLWIDAAKCKPGIDALTHYQREFNKRLGEYKNTPVHNWASHGADALRTLGVAHKAAKPAGVPKVSVRTVQASGEASNAWLGA